MTYALSRRAEPLLPFTGGIQSSALYTSTLSSVGERLQRPHLIDPAIAAGFSIARTTLPELLMDTKALSTLFLKFAGGGRRPSGGARGQPARRPTSRKDRLSRRSSP